MPMQPGQSTINPRQEEQSDSKGKFLAEAFAFAGRGVMGKPGRDQVHRDRVLDRLPARVGRGHQATATQIGHSSWRVAVKAGGMEANCYDRGGGG